MSDEIILERKGRVGSVTLNRPKALNALTQPMVLGLDARLKEWAADPAIAAVVVRGAARDDGRVPFCAGGDIRLLYGEQDDPTVTSPPSSTRRNTGSTPSSSATPSPMSR